MSSDTEFIYDPYSSQAMTDPLPIYRVLRDRYPAYKLRAFDAWALSRFQDVWEVSSDAERFSVVDGVVLSAEQLHAYPGPPPAPLTEPMASFASLDPPVHSQLRQAAGGPLRPRSVERLEPVIREMARDRLEELIPRGRFDVVTDFAGFVSAGVLCRVIGLPVEQSASVLALVNRSNRRAEGRSRQKRG